MMRKEPECGRPQMWALAWGPKGTTEGMEREAGAHSQGWELERTSWGWWGRVARKVTDG